MRFIELSDLAKYVQLSTGSIGAALDILQPSTRHPPPKPFSREGLW